MSKTTATYQRNGKLTSQARMTTDLIRRCQISCAAPAAPQGLSKSLPDLPMDYWTSIFTITYPDKMTTTAFSFDNILIFNSENKSGRTVKYPLGFPKALADGIEPSFQTAFGVHGTMSWANKKYQQTPEYSWIEGRIYDRTPPEIGYYKKGSTSMTVMPGGLEALFKLGAKAAIVANIVGSVKIQVEVTKGMKMDKRSYAKPVFILNRILLTGFEEVNDPGVTIGADVADADAVSDNLARALEKMQGLAMPSVGLEDSDDEDQLEEE